MKRLEDPRKWPECLVLITVILLGTPMIHAQTTGGPVIVGSSPHRSPGGLSAPKPVSLRHLYWHFLVYVNILDKAGVKLAAQGKNGAVLSNDLQRRLNFTNAEFAPIRLSAGRLSAELADLDGQERQVRSAVPSGAADHEQLKAIFDKRESYISAEIASLQQALSPTKKIALEAFMTQFFAPKNVVYHIPSPVQPTYGKAVRP